MKKSLSWESSSKEEDDCPWGEGYQSLKVAYGLLMMLSDHCDFLVIENEGSKAREQYRVGIHLLDPETGCWVASMSSGHASVQNSPECILVSGDPCK